MQEKTRCRWCGTNPLYVDYHDNEWGVPVYDDQKLFEFIILEGAQAGLSWITILKRREDYRKAFYNFDVEKVAQMTEKDMQHLLTHSNIIRNRLKVRSSVGNAKAFLKIQEEFGSFSNYQWCFVDGEPIQNNWKSIKNVPAKTEAAEEFSRDLKRRGFSFVGPTIMYAHMQAVGMVNDHTSDCFRYSEVAAID